MLSTTVVSYPHNRFHAAQVFQPMKNHRREGVPRTSQQGRKPPLPQLTEGNAVMMQHINLGFEDMLVRTNLVWPATQSTAYMVTHDITDLVMVINEIHWLMSLL